MLRKTLNLGILAHVDAGKTTLTERLLYAGGVIDELGSVDAGTTQTDTLALERQRGITIRSAVVSFEIAHVSVNLIDTPGHPDFIAEVERVLAVLDGAVLVVSAVEGVQPQTRLLMRALKRQRVPTLLFVNKIDRIGADVARVLHQISVRLSSAVVAMTAVEDAGTRAASVTPRRYSDARFRSELVEVLAERDDALLATYVEDEATVTAQRVRPALKAQTKEARVHPVFYGSALTGAGIAELMAETVELLPATAGEAAGSPCGTVFKIERTSAGEKIAYVRMFSGALRTRDNVRLGSRLEREGKVTAIDVFTDGTAVRRPAVVAGEIARVWGLKNAQIGDSLGEVVAPTPPREFHPPTLESVVEPRDRANAQRLRAALEQLAEQDPLIAVRQDDARNELSVSLYGEVQLEVLQATLAIDFGIDVTFRGLAPIYVERPTAAGEAVEVLHAESNPYLATIGLRVDPAPEGFGVEVRLDVDPRTVPLYIYKTLESFQAHMEQYVRRALQEGRYGWQVIDCIVTVTRCSYSVPDGPPSRRGPLSTSADFRKLTPLVLEQALARAGTVVCEPTVRVNLEVPATAVGIVVPALTRVGAVVERQLSHGELSTIEAIASAQTAEELQRQLPRLSGGEGVLDSTFAGYRAVTGSAPRRSA